MEYFDKVLAAFEDTEGDTTIKLKAAIDAYRSATRAPGNTFYLERMISPDMECIKKFVFYDPLAGVLRNVSNGKARYQRVDRGGYCRTEIDMPGGVRKSLLSHRIVWALCNDDVWPASIIDHIDQNKRNNRVENLRPCSPSENRLNVGNNKTPVYVPRLRSVVMTARNDEIRGLAKSGISLDSLADRYSITPVRVSQIISNARRRKPKSPSNSGEHDGP